MKYVPTLNIKQHPFDDRCVQVFLKLLTIFFYLFFNQVSINGQKYFSPNPKVVINQKKMNAFIASTPEIPLKAQYYNISKPVLETVLLLQSNCGTSTSDGTFNYGRVLIHPELTSYPAFSKSKNGFILCSNRSRGVEATALSLSLLRNDDKNPLTDVQWITLIFGTNGDLNSLFQQADEVYTLITGTSFVKLGINLEKKLSPLKSDESKVINSVDTLESNVQTSNIDLNQAEIKKGDDKQTVEKKTSEEALQSLPKEQEQVVNVPSIEKDKGSEPKSSPIEDDPKPSTIEPNNEIITPVIESKPEPENVEKTTAKIEKDKNTAEKQEVLEDPKPRTSDTNKDAPTNIVNNSENTIKQDNPKTSARAQQPEKIQNVTSGLYQTESYKPKHGRSAWSVYGGLKLFDMDKKPREITLIYVDESPSRDNLNSTVTVEGNQAYLLGFRYQNNGDNATFRFLIDGQGFFGSINGLSLALGGGLRLNDKGGFIIKPEISGVFGYGAKGIGTIQNNDIYIQVNDTKFQDYTNVKVAVENYFVGVKPGISFGFRTGHKSEIGVGVYYQISWKSGSITFSGKDDSGQSASDSEKLTEQNVVFSVNGSNTDKVPFNPDGLEFRLFYSF